jgi:hypothetical protein
MTIEESRRRKIVSPDLIEWSVALPPGGSSRRAVHRSPDAYNRGQGELGTGISRR